jgi:hypothetical protein
MYTNLCDYFYIKKKSSQLTPGSELQLYAEQSIRTKTKEVTVRWRKLLDTELHELCHFLDTLMKK